MQQTNEKKAGFDWIKVATTTIFVLVTAVIFLTIGYVVGTNCVSEPQEGEKTATPSPAASQTTTVKETAESKDYKNEKYGFSFQYGANWEQYKPDESDKSDDKKVLFSVGFKDPKQEAVLKQVDCINNERTEWANPSPTKAECDPVLSELTNAQKDDLYNNKGNAKPKNIFVYVYKGNDETINLSDWLTEKYRLPQTELQDYKPGKQISMAGKDGYVSNLSCCDNYNLNYVIQNKSFIYELGTNDQDSDDQNQTDNLLLQKTAKTFNLIGG